MVEDQWASDGTIEWTIFDPEVVMLGQVRLPPAVSIVEVGSDYLLGRAWDDLGVERILLHELRRR